MKLTIVCDVRKYGALWFSDVRCLSSERGRFDPTLEKEFQEIRVSIGSETPSEAHRRLEEIVLRKLAEDVRIGRVNLDELQLLGHIHEV